MSRFALTVYPYAIIRVPPCVLGNGNSLRGGRLAIVAAPL